MLSEPAKHLTATSKHLHVDINSLNIQRVPPASLHEPGTSVLKAMPILPLIQPGGKSVNNSVIRSALSIAFGGQIHDHRCSPHSPTLTPQQISSAARRIPAARRFMTRTNSDNQHGKTLAGSAVKWQADNYLWHLSNLSRKNRATGCRDYCTWADDAAIIGVSKRGKFSATQKLFFHVFIQV